MAHFYLADELAETSAGSDVVITGPEARHAVTVSRVRVGETLLVGNGRGLVVEGPVVEASGDRLVLRAESVSRAPAPSPRLVLVQALAKGDRDEMAVQAATELGVDRVVPWSAARSISRWEGPKVAKGLARWRAIAREATKQSIRPWAPEITEPVSTAQLARLAGSARLLVLEPSAADALSAVPLDDLTTGGDVVIVVGPEGGIAPHELDALVEAGGRTVRLGDSVLRTSTAGPAALAVLSVRLGRW
ncbi:16S rRNA (uracil(1498)-N(3))-methyltransferase [Frondihabitans australicus]|uniref:Ribosomal RNA small subunit methyltransferase E n=1 Tax=Frondihabitans australicus TaxID=386892 RepID=A0A495IEX9_9MICO|nr:16S rRNA (uracil(1498)-N(3))-methyltransferase [Frondihabitans australicus]RKR73901.1 16S rRNA (uracil1498-N3)-methyltransferase [Frondihabitans australicus]